MIKQIKKLIKIILTLMIIVIGLTVIVNIYMYVDGNERLFEYNGDVIIGDDETIEKLRDKEADGILVLGAGINEDGTPTPMLKDRLDTGIYLYNNGFAPKILLTGDNGTVYHNEIVVMLEYVKNAGIPMEDIFCDHAGFSTYDSMYRAKSIFQMEKAIVVTQSYHQYRALFIGKNLGIDCLGVGSDQVKYSGQLYRDIREVLARVKDLFKVKIKCDPLLGGEVIPISGDGLVSHGE